MNEATIFAAALQKKNLEQRSAYLDDACANDPALRASVESLLAAHEEAGQFLEPAGSDSTETINQPTEREGSVVGRYRLLQEIGEGGFGVVYMAEQQQPVRRTVAFKVIKPGMDTRDVIARFEAERQALAMMDHPNIARVLDAGATESGRPFFVMELVRGVPITEYCDKNKLPTQLRLELFATVCQAVQHAHQKGVIHRDIKPSNIMVTLHDGKPVPKVIDFGVSKALNQRLTEKTIFTRYGQMVGTPTYMSPEQAEMSGLDVDTRSDIYSLGVLLYELLTGTTPLDANRLHETSYAEMQRIIREDEPQVPSTRVSTLGTEATMVAKHRSTDPRKLRQEVRGELDWIVMKALDKDRGRRYETASALVADVVRYLSGDAVEACPPSTAYRLRKFVRRYKPQVAVAASFFLLLVASSVVAWALYGDARQARNAARVAEADSRQKLKQNAELYEQLVRNLRTTEELRRREQAARRTAELRLYDVQISNAQDDYLENDMVGVLASLDASLPDYRRWEWDRLRYLTGADVAKVCEFAGPPARLFALSPDGLRVAVGDEDTLRLIDLNSGEEIWQRPTANRFLFWITFSPNGELVVATHQFDVDPHGVWKGGLEVWQTASGEKLWEAGNGEDEARYGFAQFTPDGQRLLVSTAAGLRTQRFLQLRDAKTGEQLMSMPTPSFPSFAFSPSGDRLYLSFWSQGPFAEYPSTLACWNLADQKEIWSVERPTGSLVTVSRDGNQLVTGGANHSLQIWDAATGEQLEQLHARGVDLASSVSFSHNGKWIVSSDKSGYTVLWDWQKRQIVRSVRHHARIDPSPRPVVRFTTFSADDRYLVALDATPGNKIQFLAVAAPPEALTLAGHEGSVSELAVHPGGVQLVSGGSGDGTLRFWDMRTGQELQTIHADPKVRTVACTAKHVATGGSDGVKIWDFSTGRLIHHWPDTQLTWHVRFSPDGKRLVAAGEGGLKIWNVTSSAELRSPPYKMDAWSWMRVAFAPDARRVIVLDRGELSIADAGALTRVRQAVTVGSAVALTASTSDNLVAFGDAENRIAEVWDFDQRKRVAIMEGGPGEDFHCLALSPKADRLFSGSVDGFVRVLNVSSGEELIRFKAHEGAVKSLALSPDGNTLATAGQDGSIKLWETSRPTAELASKRRIVSQATKAVNKRYESLSTLRDVLGSLTGDESLEKEVLQTAIEIANARGDRPDGDR